MVFNIYLYIYSIPNVSLCVIVLSPFLIYYFLLFLHFCSALYLFLLFLLSFFHLTPSLCSLSISSQHHT